MIRSASNISVAEFYFDFLNNLNKESKLELISTLSESLTEKDIHAETSLQSLFDAYKTDESADEIIESIRASRTFNRSIESL